MSPNATTMRRCDSIVFGPIPGHGHRVWSSKQWRFRVVYEMPEICLDPELWGGFVEVGSFKRGEGRLVAFEEDEEEEGGSNEIVMEGGKGGWKKWRRKERGRLYEKADFDMSKRRSFSRKKAPGLQPLGILGSGGTPVLLDVEDEVWDSNPLPVGPISAPIQDLLHHTPRQHEPRPPTRRGPRQKDSPFIRNGKPIPHPYDGEPPTATRRDRLDFLQICGATDYIRNFLRWTLRNPLFEVHERNISALIHLPPAVRKKLRTVFSFHRQKIPTPEERQFIVHRSPPQVGEASWVSFWRAIERPCYESIRYDYIQQDADRCPKDLVTAPMQVSMRDVIVMGLVAGMQITSASFENTSVSMQGEVGIITSSNHSVLGPILHFIPRSIKEIPQNLVAGNMSSGPGRVTSTWIARTLGVCVVAKSFYNYDRRRSVRRLNERWIRDQRAASQLDLPTPGTLSLKSLSGMKESVDSGEGDVVAAPRISISSDSEEIVMVDECYGRRHGPRNQPATVERRAQDGYWTISIPENTPPVAIDEAEKEGERICCINRESRKTDTTSTGGSETGSMEILPSEDDRGSSGPRSSGPHDGAIKEQDTAEESCNPQPPQLLHEDLKAVTAGTVSVISSESGYSKLSTASGSNFPAGYESMPIFLRESGLGSLDRMENLPIETPRSRQRIQTARDLQAVRRVKLKTMETDKAIIENGIKRGAITSLCFPEQNAGHLRDSTYDSDESEKPATTAEEDAALHREADPRHLREQRGEAREERNKADISQDSPHVDAFWLSQIDIFYGYWATPWHDPSHVPTRTILTGAMPVILEALLSFLDIESLIYTDTNRSTAQSFLATTRWLEQHENSTYPAHAINAQGGIIAGGVSWTGIQLPLFGNGNIVIPPLELLHSYEWQTQTESRIRGRRQMHSDSLSTAELNTELARLDSWLSYIGRTHEITLGPNKLLTQTPALISLILLEFEADFQDLGVESTTDADEEGLRRIQGLAAKVMDFLMMEGLEEPEQLYILVALLRMVKVGFVVRGGADTQDVRGILERDVQAHLV